MRSIFGFKKSHLALALTSATLVACGSSNSSNNNGDGDKSLPETYSFESAFEAGESSVSYSGQTARNLLIARINSEAEQSNVTAAGLDYYFSTKIEDYASAPHGLTIEGFTVAPGDRWIDIPGSGSKNLLGKLAGQDNLLTEFNGWESGAGSVDFSNVLTTNKPKVLIEYFFDRLETIANSDSERAVNEGLPATYVDKYGRDFKQLTQKFLLGSVAYSQGTSDYLKKDFAANNVRDDVALYTKSEHYWDEGFGYFGAARAYTSFTDDEIAASPATDANADDSIDLLSEYNFNNSTNCAKRDKQNLGTNYTQTVFNAFLEGRHILSNAANATLSTEDEQRLQTLALEASLTWELCIASTVVHYINDTIDDIEGVTENNFTSFASIKDYEDYAKHWSEMKGFALGLQFNPDSPWNANAENKDKLAQALQDMGIAPVLADGSQLQADGTITYPLNGLQGYQETLEAIRDEFKAMYNFSDAQALGF